MSRAACLAQHPRLRLRPEAAGSALGSQGPFPAWEDVRKVKSEMFCTWDSGAQTLPNPAPPCSFSAAADRPVTEPPRGGGGGGCSTVARRPPGAGCGRRGWPGLGPPSAGAGGGYSWRMGSGLSLDDSVRVVVVGGGFGGTAAASLLQSRAVPFVLVDVRDAFHHNVAALRAAVASGKGGARRGPLS